MFSSRNLSYRNVALNVQKFIYKDVYCSIAHNRKIEMTQMSIHRGTEKIHNGAFFFKKLGGSTCIGMEKCPCCIAQWIKSLKIA